MCIRDSPTLRGSLELHVALRVDPTLRGSLELHVALRVDPTLWRYIRKDPILRGGLNFLWRTLRADPTLRGGLELLVANVTNRPYPSRRSRTSRGVTCRQYPSRKSRTVYHDHRSCVSSFCQSTYTEKNTYVGEIREEYVWAGRLIVMLDP